MFEMGNQVAEEVVLMMLLHRSLAFSPFSELWPCTVGQQAMHVIVEWSLVTVWNGHWWQYGMVTGDNVEWTPVTMWHGHRCIHPVYLYTSLLPWSPWTHENASSSHKSCRPPKGCQTSVQFLHRSWAGPRSQVVFHRASWRWLCWRRCSLVTGTVLHGHISDCPVFILLNRSVFSLVHAHL